MSITSLCSSHDSFRNLTQTIVRGLTSPSPAKEEGEQASLKNFIKLSNCWDYSPGAQNQHGRRGKCSGELSCLCLQPQFTHAQGWMHFIYYYLSRYAVIYIKKKKKTPTPSSVTETIFVPQHKLYGNKDADVNTGPKQSKQSRMTNILHVVYFGKETDKEKHFTLSRHRITAEVRLLQQEVHIPTFFL